MVRGEMPIELGASWISPKCVEAQRFTKLKGLSRGIATVSVRAAKAVPNRGKLRILDIAFRGPVRQWGISSIVKRETAQITS